MHAVLVEIWSDVVCPWCYIGKRRFEEAASRFGHRDELEVVWRSFELDPAAPAERCGDAVEHLARKYGVTREKAQAMEDGVTRTAAKVGLEYRLDRARRGNTFDAHRLLHLAADRGRQGELKERLLRAYFTDGEPIGDAATLAALATEVGLDAAEVQRVLDGDAYAEAVRRDERLASGLGATGVPFFVFGRAAAVGGAQSPEILLEAMEHAWSTIPAGASVAGEEPGHQEA
ncbi:MAG: DsbA family oxidoreductase [Acidimicrobiia bacterium]